ncbi:hypothetical protein SCLCIDRAFT_1213785 [Scleroderma citrinum Foug A]|uniref:Uncharacterized protein n=1 Tax=Scleroderma citrinum Foug A TaxID=1036808 RepID=A0A0C3E7H7_9AGAM|nr:hypothetical protein SCLCIDRAFT_1213785 [Scleroderma citrinum Foug A]
MNCPELVVVRGGCRRARQILHCSAHLWGVSFVWDHAGTKSYSYNGGAPSVLLLVQK